MSYYVKDYEFRILSRDTLTEKVREYAVEGSDVGLMLEAMEQMSEDYKLFEIPMLGSPNVFVPRHEPVNMGAPVRSEREPSVVTLYVFEWGPRGNREQTVYLADNKEEAREIGTHVVEAIALMNRGEKPENPRITPGGSIPDPQK